MSSNNWDFIETLEKYKKDLAEGKLKDEHYLIPIDQIDLPFEVEESTVSNAADDSLPINNPPDEFIQTVLPPMPIQVKVDNLKDGDEVPLDLTPLSVSRQTPRPRNILENASNVPKPMINVKVEQIPDIKPNIFVKTENIIPEPVKQTTPSTVKPFNISVKTNLLKSPSWLVNPPSTTLTVQNDSLATFNTDTARETLIIRNDLIEERRPLTIKNEAIQKANHADNEDDISTDEEADPSKSKPSKAVPKPRTIKCEILEDFQPGTSLPRPGIIKTEALSEIAQESSEPKPKKIKVEGITMVKQERGEWPIPFNMKVEEKKDH